MSAVPKMVTTVETTGSRKNDEEKKMMFAEEKDIGLRSPDTFGSVEESPSAPAYFEGEEHFTQPVDSAKDIITEVLHAKDDQTLNPWTFRTWFVGLGLSVFGSVLAQIYYFKPQTMAVSVVFLSLAAFVLGTMLEVIIPKTGFFGRWFNPHPFNSKEHTAIIIMSSTAAGSPLAAEILGILKLFYNKPAPWYIGLLLMLSSQYIGYGIAGILRPVLTYPTKMLWPSIIAQSTLVETLHGDKAIVKKKLRVFYIGFGVIFCWTVFPQYIMPITIGISIFCLTMQKNMFVTRIFGGASSNEGLGFLSLCLDWQNITSSCMWLPLQTLTNMCVGWILCMVVFTAVYQGNVWNSQSLPFISLQLFNRTSNSSKYSVYKQTRILENNIVQDRLVKQYGLPRMTGSFLISQVGSNMALTAGIVHLICWNLQDLKSAFDFATLANLKTFVKPWTWNFKFWQNTADTRDPETDDPHTKIMLAYEDAPNWWYGLCFVLASVLGLIGIHLAESQFPWWAFVFSVSISAILILFNGAMRGLTGYNMGAQPLLQITGAFMLPGRPVANMFFRLFGSNNMVQGLDLLADLKFAQYTHLSPKCTFTMQMMGALVGGVFSIVIMESITTNQREVLLSIEGTNVWSGQMLQAANSKAITWGGLGRQVFAPTGPYFMVPMAFVIGLGVPLPFFFAHKIWPKLRLDYWNTAILAGYLGYLSMGINSSVTIYFVIGFFCQFYLRKYRPSWFIKYNYILSAAMDGGAQVMLFILTFAVQGGSNKEIPFPPYWGNNYQSGHVDYCMKDPAAAK